MHSIIFMSAFVAVSSYAADESLPVLPTAHDHNALLRCVDGSKIVIGKKLGIEKEIIAELKNQVEQYDLSAQHSIYVAIPFHTAQLDKYMKLLVQCAQTGAAVHCFVNTRILRGADGKASIDRLANAGVATVYNSSELHDKGFLKIAVGLKKPEGATPSLHEDTLSGILFLGSGNLGSQNAALKNEEGWIKTHNPQSLLEAQKVFQGYAKNSQIYEGEEISYTPKKNKVTREADRAKDRISRSFSNIASPQIHSTLDTDIPGTRRNMVMQPGVTDILLESMTGSPQSILKSVAEDVAVSVVVDHSSFTVNKEELLQLSQRKNTRVLVRTDRSSSHHPKIIAVRTKTEDGTIRDMIELGSANLTPTSAQHLNSTSAVALESLSPIKKRHAQLATEMGFVQVSPTGKRVAAALPEPRKRQKSHHDGIALVSAAAVTTPPLDLAHDTIITPETTSPSVLKVRKKLF